MSSDKLVFDLSQEVEGSSNVFVKKDWLNILDNQNGNYNSNQCVIDTSQLSNSNKYMSYREAYVMMPMMLTLSTTNGVFAPATAATSADYAIGLKNWFGSIIHSFTLDYQGTTIIQQTPYLNMWNCFKLMTSLSWNDVITSGSTIGFYPDDPLSWGYVAAASVLGQGVYNNQNSPSNAVLSAATGAFNNYKLGTGNNGFTIRQQYINFDLDGDIDGAVGATTYATLFPAVACNNLWKSYIFNKRNYGVGGVNGGLIQIAVSATIYLKHVHSFFSMAPLLKGVFMKMTMNLNNTSVVLNVVGTNNATSQPATAVSIASVANAVGGTCPILIASSAANNGGVPMDGITADAANAAQYTATLSVGGKYLNNTVAGLANYATSPLAQNVYLYVPAYTFNPVFEQAYLSSPVKQIKYTDIYQYQILNVSANSGTVNNLITNGIANIKSVLVIPFHAAATNVAQAGLPIHQSPFDPAGCGPTSPLCLLTNFNVVISGQNAIYNTERYSFEQFNNQLYGQNAVNGGMTDGLTSALFNSLGFEMNYCYYYVNVLRMLPVEESVPKSVQIIGTNNTAKALDLYCFVEYGCDVSVDILTGSRV